jgi:hypothetical protein
MVPARLVKEVVTSIILCRIKRGIKNWINKARNGMEMNGKKD